MFTLLGHNRGDETGVDTLSSSLFSESVFRTLARTSLALGAKLPPSALAAASLASSSPLQAGAGAAALQAHWAPATRCSSILAEAVKAASTLIQSWMEDMVEEGSRGGGVTNAIGPLASLPMAQVCVCGQPGQSTKGMCQACHSSLCYLGRSSI